MVAHSLGSRRLRAWRTRQGLTQVVVAGQIAVAPTRFCDWERGRARPGLAYAVALDDITRGVVTPDAWFLPDPGPIGVVRIRAA